MMHPQITQITQKDSRRLDHILILSRYPQSVLVTAHCSPLTAHCFLFCFYADCTVWMLTRHQSHITRFSIHRNCGLAWCL